MKILYKELGKIVMFACLTKTCLFELNLKSSLPTELFKWPQYPNCAKVA